MGLELAVVGAGRWGSALGGAAARVGHQVTLWSPRSTLGPVRGCTRTTSLTDLRGRKLFLFTVPPESARAVARELAPHVGPDALVVHAVRGLTDEPVTTIGDLLVRETCVRRIGALGGPVLVAELEAGSPSLPARRRTRSCGVAS